MLRLRRQYMNAARAWMRAIPISTLSVAHTGLIGWRLKRKAYEKLVRDLKYVIKQQNMIRFVTPAAQIHLELDLYADSSE